MSQFVISQLEWERFAVIFFIICGPRATYNVPSVAWVGFGSGFGIELGLELNLNLNPSLDLG